MGILKLQNHRIVLVGRGLKDYLLSAPLQRQLLLHQVAQRTIQPDIEHIQQWNLHNFSGQLIPVPQHPSSLKPFPLVLSLQALQHSCGSWDNACRATSNF